MEYALVIVTVVYIDQGGKFYLLACPILLKSEIGICTCPLVFSTYMFSRRQQPRLLIVNMCLRHTIWGLLVFGRILREGEANLDTKRQFRQLPVRVRPEQQGPLQRSSRASRPGTEQTFDRGADRYQVRQIFLLLPSRFHELDGALDLW